MSDSGTKSDSSDENDLFGVSSSDGDDGDDPNGMKVPASTESSGGRVARFSAGRDALKWAPFAAKSITEEKWDGEKASSQGVTDKGDDAVTAADVADLQDKQGYLLVREQSRFGPLGTPRQYLMVRSLGRGVYGNVIHCVDVDVNHHVAVKVTRSLETFRLAGERERDVLCLLQETPDGSHEVGTQDAAETNGALGRHHILRLRDHFYFANHLCMVTDLMDGDLRSAVHRVGRGGGLGIRTVQLFARQLLHALLHMRNCGIVHLDMKPDNVLVSEGLDRVVVSDFGTAVAEADVPVTTQLVSPFYRAPEIVLGLRADCAVDMWALGATLFEVFTGRFAFPGETEVTLLGLMLEMRGAFPRKLLQRAPRAATFFADGGKFIVQDEAGFSRHVDVTLEGTTPIRAHVAPAGSVGGRGTETRVMLAFADLLERMLEVEPRRRILPDAALAHRFFRL